MKKIYSFALAAITILSAASCQKELVNTPEADTNGTRFSFIAERETETKTTLVNGKSTYWTPGDKVSAFDSEGTAVTFATAITENSASALFACENFSIPVDYNIHAIYPAKLDATLSADGVIGILRISGTQTAVAESFDPNCAYAYAKGQVTSLTTPPALQFTNIHSLVKFTIGGDKVLSETCILGFDGDLYNQRIKVELLSFIRGEKKFDSKEELKEQIDKDSKSAVEIFNSKK